MDIGSVLDARYTITATLGKGAMGMVYRAQDAQTGQVVALKVLSGELSFAPDMIERFRREGEALRQLRHPNIVGLYEVFEHGGQQVLVLEYVPGGNLHQLLRQGPLTVAQAQHITLDLCDALTRVHRLNIVHRDIKPENILLAQDGTPRLSDLGVARLLSESNRLTGTGMQVGTPFYMSPEAWQGQHLDAQADIWSLGVVLYEMLAGQVPFGGETLVAVMNKVLTAPLPDIRSSRPDVPPEMAKILRKMLARDKAKRYASMRQVGADLEQIQLPAEPVQPAARAQPAVETVKPPSQPPKPSTQPPKPPTTPPGTQADQPRPAAQIVVPSWVWGVGLAVLTVFLCLGLSLAVGAWINYQNQQIARYLPATQTAVWVNFFGTQEAQRAAEVAASSLEPSPGTGLPPSPAAATTKPSLTPARAPVTPTPPPTRVLPTPAAVEMSPIDFMVQVLVPGGPFLMGSSNDDLHASPDEKPQRSVTVPDFWVDQTEVTNAQYARCVKAGVCAPPSSASSVSRTDYYGNSAFDNYPVVNVSWAMAKAYCAWVGRRLPTEIEWEKAARGTNGDLYPWGNSPPSADLLNYNGLNSDTTRVGKFLAGVSPYGAFDMAGNVSEWTSLDANTVGPTRGGSCFDGITSVRAAARSWASQSSFVGFRCVK